MWRYLIIVCGIISLSGCGRQDVSGHYIANDLKEVSFLQLVQTPDGHLTGELETNFLKTDGTIDYHNFQVTGAANDKDVSLSFKEPSSLTNAFSASGVIEGDKITLTGGFSKGQPVKIVMIRAKMADYQTIVEALKTQSKSILEAKAREATENAAAAAREKEQQTLREIVKQIDDLSARMDKFAASAIVQIEKIAGASQRYETITSKMIEYLVRMRNLASNPSASVARTQIGVAMLQGPITADQIHFQVQSVQNDFNGNVKEFVTKVNQMEQMCHQAHPITPENPELPMDEMLNSACLRLFNAEPAFRKAYNNLWRTLENLEASYKQESAKQQQLITASQQIN